MVRVDEQTNKQTTDAIIIIKCNIFLQGRQTNKQQTLLLLLNVISVNKGDKQTKNRRYYYY